MSGKQKMIYLDVESLERVEEMIKNDVNISKFCQDAFKGWVNKSDDKNALKEKRLLLKKDYEEKLLSLNNQKQKSEDKIKKEENNFISQDNKILELIGKENIEKYYISKLSDKFTSNEQTEKLIKDLIEKTFQAYIDYLFTYKKPETTDEETEANMEKFNDKLNIILQKFMKNYKGTFNRDYFRLDPMYSEIKGFVSKNSKDFSPKIFLENKNPNRYDDSELNLYMPLKFINIH